MFARMKRLTDGTISRRGTRATAHDWSGIASSVAPKVALKSHGRLDVPPSMPQASRTGRSM
jgi:hypothetical protein